MNNLISIIIPIFNREILLPKCLDSIINQSYSNLQIILVDDGSTDNSLSICELYRTIDDRVVIIPQKNSGVSSARNSGLEVAIGDYVIFIDSDDWIEQQMIMLMMAEVTKHHLDIVMCHYTNEFNDQSKNYQTALNLPSNEVITCPRFRTELYPKLLVGKLSGCGNKLFRRSLIATLKMQESLHYGEDLLFQLEIFARSSRVMYIDKGLYHYNHHNEDISLTNKWKVDAYHNCYLPMFEFRTTYAKKWGISNADVSNNFLLYTANDIVGNVLMFDSAKECEIYLKNTYIKCNVLKNVLKTGFLRNSILTLNQKVILTLLKLKLTRTLVYLINISSNFKRI